MGTDNIIVREYLESLSESGELDHIFPLLLSLKGFKIIRTAKEALGQPQYGKDIIAVGVDSDGVKKRFYFELKGHADKDIDIGTISKPDGIRESLHEMKYEIYEDSGIPGFNQLPVKAVLVHNGIVKPNAKPVLDGLIKSLFNEGDFERWGVYELTVQFSEHLFNEYLLTDSENIRLFKRTLVLLNAPDYDLADFSALVDRLLENKADIRTRAFAKLFATLNLLAYILYHYSKENNNLEPAKKGLTILVLKTWAWILERTLENKAPVKRVFGKILDTQYRVLDDYFKTTLPVALLEDGIFSEKGGPYENVGYSMRSMKYLSYLVYFFQLRHHWPSGRGSIPSQVKKRLEKFQKEVLFKVLGANAGCRRPLLDRHSRPILMAALFVLQGEEITEDDKIRLHNYIAEIINNIILLKSMRGMLPEFADNEEVLIEYMASNRRPDEYIDSSSMLILILFELLAIFDQEEFYQNARNELAGLADLQIAYPYAPDEDMELLFFSGQTHDKMAVESGIQLPEELAKFQAFIKSRPTFNVSFRTDVAGFPFLKWLPVIYYHNDIFPQFWRPFII
ncbi:hypothetical protein [Chitinophaga sp.]|uniref:hypothetical protein n=1 Tax=Chitinophaga sp. TaxID=1869181 RepID=UPI0031DC6795